MKLSLANSVLSLLLISNAYGFVPNNNNDVTSIVHYSTMDGNNYPGTPAMVRDRINVDGKPVMSVHQYPPRNPVKQTTGMGYMDRGTPVMNRERINRDSNSLPTMHMSEARFPNEKYTAKQATQMPSSSADDRAARNEKYAGANSVANNDNNNNNNNNNNNHNNNANNRGTPVFNRQRIDMGSNKPVMSLGDYSTSSSGAYEVKSYMNNVPNRGTPVFNRQRIDKGSNRPVMSMGHYSQGYQNYREELQNPNSNMNKGTPVFNRERIDMGSNKPVMSLGNNQ